MGFSRQAYWSGVPLPSLDQQLEFIKSTIFGNGPSQYLSPYNKISYQLYTVETNLTKLYKTMRHNLTQKFSINYKCSLALTVEKHNYNLHLVLIPRLMTLNHL